MPQLHTLSVPQCRDMPSLTRLLFWNCQDYWFIYKVNQGLEVFKSLGKNLKVLQVWPDGRFTNLNRLLEYTPRLNHLIFYHCESDSESFLKAISHPRLQWIDIWANNDSTGRTVERLRQMNYHFSFPVSERSSAGGSGIGMPSLPAIRGVRVFPAYLCEWSHLPLILTPTESPEVQVVQFMSSQDSYSWYRWVMDSRVYPEEDIDSDDSDYPEPEEDDEEDTETDSTDSESAGSEYEEVLNLKPSALKMLRTKDSVFV
ncbi:hypothetical protein BJ165DRAFT_1527261 [Panaeolus papilionaceus]|nr:hypothetical protein BJ165DRAFT_1527261 [Panaeolus papilionaceus]